MTDLRIFLESAKRSIPEGFLEIKEKHDINLEVCALVAKLEKQGRYPLILFSNIVGPHASMPPRTLLRSTG